MDGEFAGLILWQLFGTTNQLLAGLALLAVTLYLLRRGKPLVYTAAPMVFMLLSTLTVMSVNLTDFWSAGQWLLLAPAATIFTLALWLVVEAALAVIRFRRNPVLDGLEVVFRGGVTQCQVEPRQRSPSRILALAAQLSGHERRVAHQVVDSDLSLFQ